jgi:hypothetical protein
MVHGRLGEIVDLVKKISLTGGLRGCGRGGGGGGRDRKNVGRGRVMLEE